MLFFKRILNEPAAPVAAGPEVERRSVQRFPISPDFPLRAVLSFIGRDESGAPMSDSRAGWNWKGRLIDCSELGARLQLGPVVKVQEGEPCDLKLAVQDFELSIPCAVTNITAQPEGQVVGLRHATTDETLLRAYRQLVEVIALASTLALQSRTPKPDASGYLVEIYAGSRPSRLTVWRHPQDESVGAFEFVLGNNMVRAAAGRSVEYLADLDGKGTQPALTEQCLEIGRLFTWVVPNLPAAVPPEVRAFLKHYAG